MDKKEQNKETAQKHDWCTYYKEYLFTQSLVNRCCKDSEWDSWLTVWEGRTSRHTYTETLSIYTNDVWSLTGPSLFNNV